MPIRDMRFWITILACLALPMSCLAEKSSLFYSATGDAIADASDFTAIFNSTMPGATTGAPSVSNKQELNLTYASKSGGMFSMAIGYDLSNSFAVEAEVRFLEMSYIDSLSAVEMVNDVDVNQFDLTTRMKGLAINVYGYSDNSLNTVAFVGIGIGSMTVTESLYRGDRTRLFSKGSTQTTFRGLVGLSFVLTDSASIFLRAAGEMVPSFGLLKITNDSKNNAGAPSSYDLYGLKHSYLTLGVGVRFRM